MADSSVPITAGVGTDIHTYTVDGKNRQVIIVGDSSVTGGIAPVTAANGLLVDVSRLTGNVTIVDGGGSITVDGTVSLGAGAASIGTLGANSGVDIGDVTINNASGASAVNIQDGGNSITVDGTVAVSGTVTVGSHAVTNAGTFVVQENGAALTALQLIDNLVLAEDAAHQSGDPGVQLLAVRQNSQSDFGADGDYVPLSVDDNGGVRVSIVAGAGSGGTAATDDSAFTAGTTNVTPVGGIVTSDSVDSGDTGAFAMLANRQQKVTLYDSAGVELAVGGGTQYDEDTAHVSGDKVTMAGVVRVDSPAALSGTDGDRTCLQVDSTGYLRVNVGNTVTVGSHAVTNAGTFAVQVSSIAAGTNNIGDVDVLTVVPGTGATALGKAEDAAHASGDTGVYVLAVRDDAIAAHSGTDGDYESLHTDSVGALWTRSTGELADDAAFTAGTSRVLPVGFFADEASTDSVDEGDIGAPRMTLDRKVITAPHPHTAGGLTIFRSLDLDETEEEVKASAGCVYSGWVSNLATSTRYLKFYNATAANVTVGTTTPVITVPIPGNSTDDITAALTAGGFGITFDTAITVAATTGLADNDTGAPSANDVVVNIFYK
jgi:hypothetical protein